MTGEIDALFRAMCAAGASDLHLSVGTPPMVRKDGRMQPLDAAAPVLDAATVVRLLDPITPEKNRHEFTERHDTDFAYEIAGLARFRANIFMDRKGRGGGIERLQPAVLANDRRGADRQVQVGSAGRVHRLEEGVDGCAHSSDTSLTSMT